MQCCCVNQNNFEIVLFSLQSRLYSVSNSGGIIRCISTFVGLNNLIRAHSVDVFIPDKYGVVSLQSGTSSPVTSSHKCFQILFRPPAGICGQGEYCDFQVCSRIGRTHWCLTPTLTMLLVHALFGRAIPPSFTILPCVTPCSRVAYAFLWLPRFGCLRNYMWLPVREVSWSVSVSLRRV